MRLGQSPGKIANCPGTGDSAGMPTPNPNDIMSSAASVQAGNEVVTVPSGTFDTTKYTITHHLTTQIEYTDTYWVVTGKPVIKADGSMPGINNQGNTVMELNDWG